MTKWKHITTEAEYHAAMDRINTLIDIDHTDDLHNELMLLTFLVEEYESEHYAMPDASPLEVIKYAMEMKGIRRQDLEPVLGTKGNVSKILSGKANLHVGDLHPLSMLLGLPVDALIPKSNAYAAYTGVTAQYVAEPEHDLPLQKPVVRKERKTEDGLPSPRLR